MGRRCEPRTAISFPVVVRGFDPQGNPFALSTETCDVSHTGASIKGLEHLVHPGTKIEIEFKDQKAWYRVQWIGKNGSAKAGRVGVRCLERKYMWDVPAATWERDTFGESPCPTFTAASAAPAGSAAPAAPASLAPPAGLPDPAALWDGKERRLFSRRPCRIETQVSIPGSPVRLNGKVTDVSLGGCYVEMLAPLPIDTSVELVLTTGDIVLRAGGKVRTSQAGLGMGIGFTIFGPGEFEKLRRIAPPATAPPSNPNGDATQTLKTESERSNSSSDRSSRLNSNSTAIPSSPPRMPTTAEALEAVIRALLRKNLLSREDLAKELDVMKSAKS